MSCTKKDLVALGFREYQARRIIAQAKQELVKRGYDFYTGVRVGRVPSWMVEEIIGFQLTETKETHGKKVTI